LKEKLPYRQKKEEKFVDKEPKEEKPKTKKVRRKKKITPLSTLAQEEESLSLDSLDT
jgi:hypothetical protein